MTDPIRGTKEELRKFGILFAVISVAAGIFARYAGSGHWGWWVGAGVLFLGTGIFAGTLLRPFYIVWMRFAHLLAWVNTRILLGVVFFLVMTPVGLVLRLMGKDLLDERIDPTAKSYWKKREPAGMERARYERLF